MFSCNSSCDLNGDNEDVTISANDGRASSCNMSVSRLMRRRGDTKVCTDPPARVTNNQETKLLGHPIMAIIFAGGIRMAFCPMGKMPECFRDVLDGIAIALDVACIIASYYWLVTSSQSVACSISKTSFCWKEERLLNSCTLGTPGCCGSWTCSSVCTPSTGGRRCA